MYICIHKILWLMITSGSVPSHLPLNLLSIYYMLGIALGTGDSNVKKTNLVLTFLLPRSVLVGFILNHLH